MKPNVYLSRLEWFIARELCNPNLSMAHRLAIANCAAVTY